MRCVCVLQVEKAEARAELKSMGERLEQALAEAADATDAREAAENRAEEASSAAENAAIERDAMRAELGDASEESVRANKGFEGEIRRLMEVRASDRPQAATEAATSTALPLQCVPACAWAALHTQIWAAKRRLTAASSARFSS